MKQLYSQWDISKDFCLNQLLGYDSQKVVNDLVNDKYFDIKQPSVFMTEGSKTKRSIYPNERNKTYNTNSSDSIITDLPPSSNENNSITKSNNCHYNTSIWIELEPIAETDSIVECVEGILNIDNLVSQGL